MRGAFGGMGGSAAFLKKLRASRGVVFSKKSDRFPWPLLSPRPADTFRSSRIKKKRPGSSKSAFREAIDVSAGRCASRGPHFFEKITPLEG